jgi:hypothetical protein
LFGDSLTVNLGDVLSGIDKEVDSIKLFNITLLIDSTTGTAPGTKLSGLFLLRNNNQSYDTLFVMNNMPLPTFAEEQSVFDPKLTSAGFTYNPTFVNIMHGLLQQNPQPMIHLALGGIGSSTPLHFNAHLKIYTQVFAKIKN